MRAGLYPPLWVLSYLRESFVRVFNEGLTFDRALGFSMKGLGSGSHESPIDQLRKSQRNKGLVLNVFKLEALGLKRQAAARAVAAFHTKATGEELGERRVVDIVKENESAYTLEQKAIVQGAVNWTNDARRQLLRAFDVAVPATKKRK